MRVAEKRSFWHFIRSVSVFEARLIGHTGDGMGLDPSYHGLGCHACVIKSCVSLSTPGGSSMGFEGGRI